MMRLIKFRDDERGAAGFLMLSGLLPLTLLMFFIVNSAKSVNDKNRTQDAADAIALVHATEAARALNTISKNQVTLTQAYAVGVTMGTLNDTVNIHFAMLAMAQVNLVKFFADCARTFPPTNPVSAAALAVCVAPGAVVEGFLIKNFADTMSLRKRYKPGEAFETASDAVKAADKMNQEIFNRFPGAIQQSVSPAGKTAKASDFYFDESCARGKATSCKASNKRQGMELPIEPGNSFGSSAHAHFCGALFFGSGGIAGLSVINGSYIKRRFPSNKGPMRSGSSSNPLLYDHVNRTTRIGRLLSGFQDIVEAPALWGVSTEDWGPMPANYPYDQSISKNIFIDWVKVRVALKCTNASAAFGALDWANTLDVVFSIVPNFQLYHPIGVGLAPKILPQIDDFSDAYKPLAFVHRKPNERWAPKVFKSPKPGFYAYAQAITYNPDEIGLYSQNWMARLIPAKKMNSMSPILQRMKTRASASFESLEARMSKVTDQTGWRQINAH